MTKGYLLAFTFVVAAVPAAWCEKRFILEAPPAEVSRVATQNGLTVVRPVKANVPAYVVSAPDAVSDSNWEDRVRSDPSVDTFERNSTSGIPEGRPRPAPLYAVSGALQSLSIPGATSFFGAQVRNAYVRQPASALVRWLDCQNIGITGGGIVAILDTGVDATHPALRNVVIPGYDFVNDTEGIPSDLQSLPAAKATALSQSTVAILDKTYIAVLNQSTVAILDQSTVAILDNTVPAGFGHGTMVAGLVHLVAPTAKIMPLRVFHDDGSVELADIVAAVYYAVDHGATVINMSFSMSDNSREFLKAINYAIKKGVICVAAVGNDGREVLVYPAGFRTVFGVASTTMADERSLFSNYGESITSTAAPGEALVTTYPGNNYAAVWGTSFSAALVSGAVSLLDQVQFMVSSKNVGKALDHGKKVAESIGESRLDAFQAVMALKAALAIP